MQILTKLVNSQGFKKVKMQTASVKSTEVYLWERNRGDLRSVAWSQKSTSRNNQKSDLEESELRTYTEATMELKVYNRSWDKTNFLFYFSHASHLKKGLE